MLRTIQTETAVSRLRFGLGFEDEIFEFWILMFSNSQFASVGICVKSATTSATAIKQSFNKKASHYPRAEG